MIGRNSLFGPLDPGHGRRASDFEKAMRGRNRLLSDGRFDPVWLDGIEKQMAELGIAMAVARHEMLGSTWTCGYQRMGCWGCCAR